MSFETLSGTYDSDYYAPGLNGLGDSRGAAPSAAYVMAGSGVPADVAVGRWQNQDWTVNSYNAFLQTVRQTLLTWDRQGWANNCWGKNPGKRREWVQFLTSFGQQAPVYAYVSGSDELAALYTMSRLLSWNNWLMVFCDPRIARLTGSPRRSRSGMSGFGELGDFGALPLLYVLAGTATAAGGVVAAWLKQDEWSPGEYNYRMAQMHATILAWDKLGWQKGCWKDPTRRELWKSFMSQFGQHYARGKIADHSYVSDSDEKPARDLMRRLAEWGEVLNQACAAGVSGGDLPAPPAPPAPPEGGFDLNSALKWGALLVGGVIGLNLIGGLKGVTGGPRA
jgi:hypothetical protein